MEFSDERVALIVAREMQERAFDEENKDKMARDFMPVVSKKDIGDGITEKVVFHMGWIDGMCMPRKLREEMRFLSFPLFGKYQYLWKKDDEEISCVQVRNFLNHLQWETCHPEMRYSSLREARSYIKKYFNNKLSKPNKRRTRKRGI